MCCVLTTNRTAPLFLLINPAMHDTHAASTTLYTNPHHRLPPTTPPRWTLEAPSHHVLLLPQLNIHHPAHNHLLISLRLPTFIFLFRYIIFTELPPIPPKSPTKQNNPTAVTTTLFAEGGDAGVDSLVLITNKAYNKYNPHPTLPTQSLRTHP